MHASSGASRLLPRRAERLKIPTAAFWLKKKRAEAWVTSTCDKKDSDPSLGHTEVLAVQHSPLEVRIPAFGHRRLNEGEIASIVAGKESSDILKEYEAGLNRDDESEGFPVES